MGILKRVKFLLYYLGYCNRKQEGRAEYVLREDNGYNRTWTSSLFFSNDMVVGTKRFFCCGPVHGYMSWTEMSKIKEWEF